MSNNLIPAAKPIIGEEERAAVDRVLASGMIAQGPEVAAFEKEFSSALAGGRECVAVNSGTSGQHLGLLASGIKPGDEVIVPSFTFAATANAVAVIGATPVFVDIDLDTFCMDPAQIEAAITERTVAIEPVHLYGHPAAMEQICEIAKKHNLWVGEDAAQAHGATLNGKQVGTFGRWGMFSLYPTKNMTSGEGGMVSCEDAETARRIRLFRNQGMEKQYANEVAGFNNRMTDIHAAIGRVQLTKLEAWTKRRQETAAFFDEHLESVVTPKVAEGATHVYHQYTIRIDGASAEERDRFAQALREEYAVGCGVYYPTPVHRLASFDRRDAELPVTEKAAREVLSLPVHPSVSDADRERVVEAVNAVAKAGA
ncbi:DegT/DnrJ/EryC1/StrS family aminotransferase [Dermabacter jinjuensis]|uniref:Aminotransferase DegT n=1 Tax=Dermabacter jinjuensis TaxID=1667168 RepID=A0ABM6PM11_9MICO|nr:DegT/DnrJ/EryC1/StrS family aminotransferase [Dermabacter jinjuensis]ATH96259.1 aminotransferase DegT [Dermabacter jinjuensis]UEB90332.1 DegT/DnrJ/EryC1/StrS family aminotransferase [Dermabacter jinjuensis]